MYVCSTGWLLRSHQMSGQKVHGQPPVCMCVHGVCAVVVNAPVQTKGKRWLTFSLIAISPISGTYPSVILGKTFRPTAWFSRIEITTLGGDLHEVRKITREE